MISKAKAKSLLKQIGQMYPDAWCELNHSSAFQLLVATILSAQSTDVGVNKVTPALFQAYPDAYAMARAQEEDLIPYLRTLGLYQAKARHLVATAQRLVKEYQGQVPSKREDLMTLPGVGRKTANVVLSVAFGQPAFAVDTHVQRVAKRLDLVPQDADPLTVEKTITSILPAKDWSTAHHQLIFFGRYHCKAKKPLCHVCPLAKDCHYYQQQVNPGGK